MEIDIPQFKKPTFASGTRKTTGGPRQPTNGTTYNKKPYGGRRARVENTSPQQPGSRGRGINNRYKQEYQNNTNHRNKAQPVRHMPQQQQQQHQLGPAPSRQLLYPHQYPPLAPNQWHARQIQQGYINPVHLYCDQSEMALVMALRAQRGDNVNANNIAPATMTDAQSVSDGAHFQRP